MSDFRQITKKTSLSCEYFLAPFRPWLKGNATEAEEEGDTKEAGSGLRQEAWSGPCAASSSDTPHVKDWAVSDLFDIGCVQRFSLHTLFPSLGTHCSLPSSHTVPLCKFWSALLFDKYDHLCSRCLWIASGFQFINYKMLILKELKV